MQIRVLLLCSRENACCILGCLVGQPDISIDFSRDIQEFRLHIEKDSYDLIVLDELKESLTDIEFIHGIHRIQAYSVTRNRSIRHCSLLSGWAIHSPGRLRLPAAARYSPSQT